MVREVSEGEINDKRTRPSAYSPVIVTEEADEELVAVSYTHLTLPTIA